MVGRMRMAFLVPVQIFFRGIWQVVPWLLRFIYLAFWSYIMTVSSLWEGVPKTTDVLARRWEETAIEAGVDSVYAHKFYWLCRIAAVIVIVAVWISLSFVTVFLVMQIV